MKYKFLRRLKVQKQEVIVDAIVMDQDIRKDEVMDMFIGCYEDMKFQGNNKVNNQTDYDDYVNNRGNMVKTVISNIDEFRDYNFDFDYRVSLKQARTMTEEKRPFVISKNGTKKEVEDIDTIYHTALKMKVEDKSIQRLGFLMTDKKEKTIKLGGRNKRKYRGIISGEYPIYKKRPFNTKKIGYIKLAESTPYKDLYVEVVEKRGCKWMLALLAIICSIGLFLKLSNFDDWQINWERLTAFKTEEVIEQKESQINISFNPAPSYSVADGKISLQLESEAVENVTYRVKVYMTDTNELLYKSDKISAGDGISEIYVNKDFDNGSCDCYIECDTYKNGIYMGTMSSSLVINIAND